MKKNITIGILAHVDAGKTTLSEAFLYLCGAIRSLGRVDKKDAFLDHFELERSRRITIFSKIALLETDECNITLLDTPGHVDFSAEMERTLLVLDYAVLVISAADGVQSHTRTLWKLLKHYGIPVFIFFNKMDQKGCSRKALLDDFGKKLEDGCVDFAQDFSTQWQEQVAVCCEELLDEYLENNYIADDKLSEAVLTRRVFPCYFGSALKLEGVEELLQGIGKYAKENSYIDAFAARVYKIARDEQGIRLTYLKVLGKSLKVRQVLEETGEKISGIRIYNGDKYTALQAVNAGCICAVTGLNSVKPGDGLGEAGDPVASLMKPMFHYRVNVSPDTLPALLYPKLKQLEEEEPVIHVLWNEEEKEITIQVMGEIQLEILKSLAEERFGEKISFSQGHIVYKETIAESVVGLGHFEPLRHYAEVHLLLEPMDTGSGLVFRTDCSEDVLNRSWQRLILSHLEEKAHIGVLTGSPVTDMQITLIAGRAHNKHTEGGDFRQATYRAVRQGLRQAKCILLEPYYDYILEVPWTLAGRAMADLTRMNAEMEPIVKQEDMAVLRGKVPVVCMMGYQLELANYSSGLGHLTQILRGYEPCHNQEEVVKEMGYDPDRDADNPSSSVFCTHGAGFVVEWNKVKPYMHIECRQPEKEKQGGYMDPSLTPIGRMEEQGKNEAAVWMASEEVDRILEKVLFNNRKKKGRTPKNKSARIAADMSTGVGRQFRSCKPLKEYLLVDGYNIIFAWEELRELSKISMDAARGKLLDELCNYQAIRNCSVMVVFDAYRVENRDTKYSDYLNIQVVFTKEAETADQYIEKFAHSNAGQYRITVATSDCLEQIITRGEGCFLLSAAELYDKLQEIKKEAMEEFKKQKEQLRNYPMSSIKEFMNK